MELKQQNRRGLAMETRIKEALSIYYSGPITTTKISFLIRCPWHEDQNPSCQIYKNTGVFRCWTCHSDSSGITAYKGFQALGMSEVEAKILFFSKQEDDDYVPITNEDLPDIMPEDEEDDDDGPGNDGYDFPDFQETIDILTWQIENASTLNLSRLWKRREKFIRLKNAHLAWMEQNTLVASRRSWEKTDGENGNYRKILYETLTSKEFIDTYNPSVVRLKFIEPEERLALKIGNSVFYEVYVRQKTNSVLKLKSINQKGLSFKPGEMDLGLTPFGLKRLELPETCKGLLVTEGPYDCMRLHQHCLQQNLPYQVIALLGTPNADYIFRFLKKHLLYQMFKNKIPLILAFDHDSAGMDATSLFLLKYEQFFNEINIKGEILMDYIKILSYPLEVGDPGDLELEAFLKALNT